MKKGIKHKKLHEKSLKGRLAPAQRALGVVHGVYMSVVLLRVLCELVVSSIEVVVREGGIEEVRSREGVVVAVIVEAVVDCC